MRNDAFHREIMNSAILSPVTELLFLTVAELARDFPIHSYTIPGGSPSGENAAFLKRFGLERADIFEENKEKIYRKLIEGVALNCSLPAVLSEDLTERLDDIVGGLSYLNDDATDREKLDHNLRYTQFWRDRGAEVMRKPHTAGRAPKEELEEAYAQWAKTPGPHFTMDAIERQRRHASSIANAKHPADALVRYWAIQKWMVPLEEDVHRAVHDYDEHINALVHDRMLERTFDKRSPA